MKENMSIETTAAGGAAILKFFGVPIAAGTAATVLAFLFMWPKTRREAFVRLACSIISSAVFGPFLVVAVRSWWPTLFTAAGELADLFVGGREITLLFVAAPLLVLAGLPSWWLLGGIVLWLDKRRGKDIAEIAHDAAEAVRDVRGAL